MLQGPSHLLRRTTRTLNARLKQQFGAWRNSTIFSMVESLFYKLIRKPLVSIFRKHMIDVSPRIQRITIRAWQYDFIPQHIPGRINVIADSLSRVTPLEFQDSNAEKDILAVNFLQYSSIEERERDEMLQETNKDEELQSLKHYISTGWPAKRSQIPVSLHPYWNFRDELTVESGILMKNSKVLIPETLKQKYLKQIHQGHQGIEACRSRAREFVFWVNINSDSERNGRKVWHMPVPAEFYYKRSEICFWSSSTSMAHAWLRSILFSKNWLSSCCRLFLQVPDRQKASKLYIQCSHQRIRNDLLRIWKPTSLQKWQWTLLLESRIQILHAELASRAQNQFSTLSTEQWFGRIHGKGIQESDWESY